MAVRRVGRRAVIVRVVGEVSDLEALQVQGENVELGVPIAGEGDPAAIGAPGWRLRLLDAQIHHVDDAVHSALEHVDEDQAPAFLPLGEDRQPVAVRREREIPAHGAARGQELAVEVLKFRRQPLGEVRQQAPSLDVEEHDVQISL